MPRREVCHASFVYPVVMEIRHLSYFRTVAELRSFTKAAVALHTTQPSLSRQMKDLEKELGYQLLQRTSVGVELTRAGEGLYGHLDNVFSPIEQIPEVIRVAAEAKELIRVGVPQGLPHDWFNSRLNKLERNLPHVALSLQEATTDEQRKLLQKGELDLALIHVQSRGAETTLVLEQEMGLAVPETSPLSAKELVSFSELEGLKIMAHAVGEIAAEETRLRNASMEAGVTVNWVFRRFSEHSWLIAKTANVDGILVTRASAERHIPEWRWVPIWGVLESGQQMRIQTWATWNEPTRLGLRQVVELLKEKSEVDDPAA